MTGERRSVSNIMIGLILQCIYKGHYILMPRTSSRIISIRLTHCENHHTQIPQRHMSKYALANTKGTIKNGQTRDTGNIVYTRHRTKTNKTRNTTQKTTKISNTDPSETGVNPVACEGQGCFLVFGACLQISLTTMTTNVSNGCVGHESLGILEKGRSQICG